MFDSKTWVPAGHFYSPLVDPEDAHVRKLLSDFPDAILEPDESLALDDETILETFQQIQLSYSQLDFPQLKTEGFRYFYENPAFSYGDAVTYFGLLLALRPKRVIEVGSGFSSCLLMDTNDRHLRGEIRASFIDPYPDTLFALLPPDDKYLGDIKPDRLQDVDRSFFEELGAGDILFLDSSHIAKTGSDVNDYLFRIFPVLRSGVVIHIHDIFYPFEYGPAWIEHENRSWNEAFAVRAFLQYNNRFKIIYFNHYMYRQHPELLKATPLTLRNCGGSLWLRKL